MKKTIVLLITFVVCTFLFSCAAQAEDALEMEFADELATFEDALPEEIREGWINRGKDALQLLDIRSIGEWIFEKITAIFPSMLRQLAQIMALIICFAIYEAMQCTLETPALRPAWELCSTLCLGVAMADWLTPLLARCTQVLEMLSCLTGAVTPLVCAISAAGGNLNGAAVSRMGLLLFLSLLENLYSFFLLPPVKIAFCLSLLPDAEGVCLDGIGRLVRRAFAWFLALLGVLFSFFIGMQNVIAKSADSLTQRTVKFALGSMIPMVGGALSEALGSAVGSLRLLKNSCGIFGMLAALIVFLPILLELLLTRLVLSIGQGAAEMVGASRPEKLFAEMHGVLGYLLAVLSIVSFLLIFLLALWSGFFVSGGSL